METNIKKFFVTPGGVAPYNVELHGEKIRRFLFWEEWGDGVSLLIASPPNIEDNQFENSHKGLRHMFQNFNSDTPTIKPDGAGDCEKKRVDFWGSTGFDVITPEELRPIIRKALGF